MELTFSKMHGLGNDFVVIEDLAEDVDLSAEAVAWFCDRNFGIGGDGLILVRPATTPEADFFMLYYNSDGTTAEMCGNGVRCFAKYVVDHKLLAEDRNTLRVETLGGVKPIEITRAYDGTMYLATVDMGAPILRPADVPTALRCEGEDAPVIACDLETEKGTFQVTCVSMGNPHCIIWVDDVYEAPVHDVGPIIETHPAFPNKTNVEFAERPVDETIRLRVWERGCGETLACGTGACATAVAAALNCLGGREYTVELPGGDLAIRWDEDGTVFMTGPAEEVFSGTLTIPEYDEYPAE